MIKVATLFSGIGTPEQSLKYLGIEHETVFACEIDKYARTTYLANNQTPNTFYEDVYLIDGNKYKNQIDILIGGSPCQSFSVAGKRHGLNDPRGNLIYEYFRIVEESQPKVFIYENVKGFLSIDKGETFKNFVQSFKELGYTVYHQVLNTKDYQVPQNRERIYIVGFKDNVDFHFQEKQELKLRLKDMLEDEVAEKYLLNQELVSKYLETGTASNYKGSQAGKVADENGKRCDNNKNIPITRRYEIGNKEISNCLSGVQKDSYIAIANGVIEIDNDEVRVNEAVAKGYSLATEGDSINISVPGSKTRRGRVGKQVAQTLDTACNQVVFKKIEKVDDKYIISDKMIQGFLKHKDRHEKKGTGFKWCPRDINSYASTLRANAALCPTDNSIQIDRFVFRKLTPRECFRLQGFDDSFVFPEKMSDTQLYKQAGNSMSRNITDMILTQIFICFAKYIENKGS